MALGPKNPKITFANFGGLNVGDHSYRIPGEFTELVNIDRSTAELRTRKGGANYLVTPEDTLGGIQRMHRYRNTAGTKQIMAYDGANVWVDNEDGVFGSITAFDANADGSCDFCQYRNSVIIASENNNLTTYHPGATSATMEPLMKPLAFGATTSDFLFDATFANTGGGLLNKIYYWRMTFDIEHGGDFLGETPATSLLPVGAQWQYAIKDWTGETNAPPTNLATFKRPPNAVMALIPTTAVRLNIYRSPGYDAEIATNYIALEDAELFRVATLNMSDVRLLAAGATMFTDAGSENGGLQVLQQRISRGLYWNKLRARYAVMHKGRLWLGHPSVPSNVNAAYTEYPDAIMCSRFTSNGEEPFAFQVASPKITIDHYTGEGITAIGSWRGKTLVACKPNSSHAIIGGDDNIADSIPNIQHEILDPVKGCIAPRTFIDCGGPLVWLSNEGVVAYDGGGGVQTIDAHKIKPILDAVDSEKRRLSHAYYDSTDQEYYLFLYPNKVLRYSFRTRLWTMDVPLLNVGAALEIKDSDGQVRVLYGIDDDPAALELLDVNAIITAKLSDTEASGGLIAWRAATGYEHLGLPVESKKIIGAVLEGEWHDDVRVDFVVIDAEANGETAPLLDSLVFEPPAGGIGTVEKAFKNDVVYVGKRIKTIFSGSARNGRVHIAGLTLRVPLEGERPEQRLS